MDSHLLVQQFCGYSNYIRGYSKATIQRYRKVLELFLKDIHASEIGCITRDQVRSWFFNGRTAHKWNPNTFHTYLKTLKVFFCWCVREGYLGNSPVADIEKPRLEKRLPAKLTKQDALRLLEVVYNYPYNDPFERHRDHAVLATFMFAGLRKQELLNLKLTNVDLTNYSIFVQQGKGNKDRIIPIPYTLTEILHKYLRERQRLGKTCPEFFTSFVNNARFPEMGLRKLVSNVRAVSGVKFTPHMLRHTFATLMLEGGCDIYSLSKMLGHTDIKTTTIYLAASVEHLRRQINKHPLNN